MLIDRTGPISEVGHEPLITPRILEQKSQIIDTYVFMDMDGKSKCIEGMK